MSNTVKYIAKSFVWVVLSKFLDAILKFISLPILLIYFGKDNYGLITLALSVNAYLQLLDMGINTGAIKYFSEWLQVGKKELVDSVARTSLTFYGIIGLVNTILLLFLVFFGVSIFSITHEQAETFKTLLLILASFSIFNWSTSVFNQLLIASESIYFVQQVNIYKSIFSFILVLFTTNFKLSVTAYFFSHIVINTAMIIPFYIKVSNIGLIRSFIPAFHWKDFSVIFKYSLAIIAIGVFQMSAAKLRPLVLGVYIENGVAAVADYRIIETITLFIISIGGMFSSIFLPKTSKLLAEGNRLKIEKFAYQSTLYTSIVCVMLCFPFILCGREILSMYVGDDYLYLNMWLILWVFTILGYLHSTPVNSIVLATGKTKILIYSTAFSCIVSVLVNIYLVDYFGIGSAVVGYAVYIFIQMMFYYTYFNSKVLGLNSFKIFISFLKPTVLGGLSWIVVYLLDIKFSFLALQAFVKVFFWILIFSLLIFIFKLVNFKKLYDFVNLKYFNSKI